MSKLLLSFLLAASAALPTVAAADDAPAPTQGDDIIVQGTVTSRKEVYGFVKELTPAPIGGQLGRFLAPVCPRVIGLPQGQGAMVEARMLKVAAASGVPVASQPCVTNIYVLVGGDKEETINGLRKKFPKLVAGVPASVLKRLAEAEGPVAAWQIVGEIGPDGMPLHWVRTSTESEPVQVSNTIGWASRITRLTRPQFVGSILVVEAKAIDGVDTRQLADYAVMRTMAPTDTTHRTALPARSIIQLFDPGASPDTAPMTVTHWDFAFLKALYASSNDVAATQQRGEMARKMAKELATVPPDQR
jgi:hypothetical protein